MGAEADRLRMTMPINVRTEETADLAGNQFVPARFPIPLDIDDPAERIQVIHDLVAVQRAEPAMALVEPLARVLNRLPTSMSTGIFGSMLKGVDLVTSNVPGAPIPIYIAGGQIEALFAFGPMTGAAANLTLLSYRDDLHIGDQPRPRRGDRAGDRSSSCYRAAWDELVAVG